MNILIYIDFPFKLNTGGVQRSTHKMGLMFKNMGYECIIVENSVYAEARTVDGLKVFSVSNITDKENVELIQRCIEDYNIDAIINQCGSDYKVSNYLYRFKNSGIKLISTLRMNPLNFVQNYDSIIDSKFVGKAGIFLKSSIVKKIALLYHRIKQAIILDRIIKQNNYFVLLNNQFIKELKYFNIGDDIVKKKVRVIPNVFSPVADTTIEKENIILYVGRLEQRQKRMDLLGEIWTDLALRLPDWRFHIIGSGSFENKLKEHFKLKSIDDRIKFHGSCDPTPYYQRAKIFTFTSAYEGLGNVLIEAQQHRVVPIMFNSYSAASDLVRDGVTGRLIKPFDLESYVQKSIELAENKEILTKFSRQGQLHAKQFEYEAISKDWNRLLLS